MPKAFNKTLKIDPDLFQYHQLEDVPDILKKSGVVVFPTSGLYGLGADAMDVKAVTRIYQIKKRPFSKPLLMLIDSIDELAGLVRRVPPVAGNIIRRFWPGHVTIIFEAGSAIPDIITGKTGKIGIRQCSHPVAISLIRSVGKPITGTSANLSGKPGCTDIDHLDPSVAATVDKIIDAGKLCGGAGSTIVDVTQDPVRIIRDGRVSAQEILAAI